MNETASPLRKGIIFMIKTIYSRALSVLMKKPLKLWGISLLSIFLCSVFTYLCGVAIPGLALAISVLMTTSMTMIYLSGYRGENVQTVQLFSCFKDWQTIKRVVLGMGWMILWIFLWALIPFAGIVFAVIRAYEYRLTPYILVTEPEISITDAIKVSAERTRGYKGTMFLADLLVVAAYFSVALTLTLLGMIPYVGILFLISLALFSIAYMALQPLFTGLIQAAFYEEITNPTIPAKPEPKPEPAPVVVEAPAAPVIKATPAMRPAEPLYTPAAPVAPAAPAAPAVSFCPSCGSACVPNAKFCGKCGQSLR